MGKRPAILFVITVLVFTVTGFLVGRTVQADTAQPGSPTDPLVTKSYVDKTLEKIPQMETRLNTTSQNVDSLVKKVADLEKKVAALESKLAKPAPPPAQTLTVTGTSVNVRTGPGTKYSIITTLKKGTTVTYIKTQDNWKNIKMSDGRTGWMHKDYLK